MIKDNLESNQPNSLRLSRYADADGMDTLARKSPLEPHNRRTVSSRPVVNASRSAERVVSPSSRPQPIRHSSTTSPLSEARAYASAMATTMDKKASPSINIASASPIASLERRGSRPLPRPPSQTRAPPLSQKRSSASIHVIASNDGTGRRNFSPPRSPRSRPNIVIPPEQPAIAHFDFPRSPTLPALIDPRTASGSAYGKRQSSSQTLAPNQLPSRTSSVHVLNATNATALSPSADQRKISNIRSTTLPLLLSHPNIQGSLLSSLTINSFLSLTGTSESIRRCFTGESVGRWVMREWGIEVDRERGRSWPNLTVWEGFCEWAALYQANFASGILVT
jgi:hypothetical protein